MNWLKKLGKLFMDSMEANGKYRAASVLIAMGRPDEARKVMKGNLHDD